MCTGSPGTATALDLGAAHNCALLDDKTVKWWGYNFYGSLGLGDNFDSGDNANEMWNNLPPVPLCVARTARLTTLTAPSQRASTRGKWHTFGLRDASLE